MPDNDKAGLDALREIARTRPVSRHQALAANRRYVTLKEAGDLLGCHPRTVRRLIAAGRLTGYRLGGRLLRVDLAEVDAVMRPLPAAGQSA